ncbi:MAG TPA: pyridoxine 5'-phosphate synthase [Polyangiales bacterium]|nr:pyridoxine 5'-phosphate synthase [Polyangiales bacterium]
MAPRLSVNVNKVATLRNARGGSTPSVLQAVDVCLEAGARSITLHWRKDERHVRRDDVYEVADRLLNDDLELNIEGDPRAEWMALVSELGPDQATLVPVRAGELTSEAGWPPNSDPAAMSGMVKQLRRPGTRVSLFIEPTLEAVRWAHAAGADRVELYTEPFARAFERSKEMGRESFEIYVSAARAAHELGMGVNAGHDLDLENLVMFRELPHLDEVSIGHALISRALFGGLGKVVREYLSVLRG